MWGVAKTRFVNIRNEIEMSGAFPEPQKGPRNTHLYDAKAALEALFSWETRNDKTTQGQTEITARILGLSKEGSEQSAIAGLSPASILSLNRAAAEIEQREREQGLWTRTVDVNSVVGDVFSLISDKLSALENEIDPNGLFEADVRDRINKAGRKTLGDVYKGLRKLLDVDARDAGTAHGGSGRKGTRSRRKSADRTAA